MFATNAGGAIHSVLIPYEPKKRWTELDVYTNTQQEEREREMLVRKLCSQLVQLVEMLRSSSASNSGSQTEFGAVQLHLTWKIHIRRSKFIKMSVRSKGDTQL